MALLKAFMLEANVQKDVTGGGLGAAEGGTYMLNLCNDTASKVNVSAVYVTNGEAPTDKHKVQPRQEIEPFGWRSILPLKLGLGFKVFLTADAPLSVQLNAQAD